MKLINKSLIFKAAAFSLLAAIVMTVLMAGKQTPASQAASSYPFPGRAEDLKPNEYWHFANIHAGGGHALDLTGIRYSNQTNQWTIYKQDGVSADDDYNTDFVIYDKPVHAIADGEVVACWRNAPNNIRPGDVDDGGTPHPGRLSDPKTIARSGNFLVVKTKGENRTVLYAHLKPGSVPPGFCPNNGAFMEDADNKYDPVAGKNIDYPIESLLPAANRPQIKAGDEIGRVGNAGASSGPHLHIDMSDIVDTNEEGPSLQIDFDGGWVQQRTPGVDVSDNNWQLLTGQNLDAPPQVILPDYTSGRPELAK
ncbi:MAG: M23 family metallopeptidase, partial [Acidobacteriota bacterium]